MPEFYRQLRALGLSLEETVNRMTLKPAERFELKSRGIISKGAFADIVIWDESEFKGNSTYVMPHQFSSGVDCVIVNGSISYNKGSFTGKRAGRMIV